MLEECVAWKYVSGVYHTCWPISSAIFCNLGEKRAGKYLRKKESSEQGARDRERRRLKGERKRG